MLTLLLCHANGSAEASSSLGLPIACVHHHTHLRISTQAAAAAGHASGRLQDFTIGQCCKAFAGFSNMQNQ